MNDSLTERDTITMSIKTPQEVASDILDAYFDESAAPTPLDSDAPYFAARALITRAIEAERAQRDAEPQFVHVVQSEEGDIVGVFADLEDARRESNPDDDDLPIRTRTEEIVLNREAAAQIWAQFKKEIAR